MKGKRLILALVLLTIFYLAIQPDYQSFQYISRTIRWGNSDVQDYLKFPYREMQKGETVFQFQYDLQEESMNTLIGNTNYTYKGNVYKIGDAERFFAETGTTAFIVIQNDRIIYEKYASGYAEDSIFTSFSMAKSFVSFLIGRAIDDGYIENVDEPITNYIPELKEKGLERVTIKHLLKMASGIHYQEGRLFFGDDAKTYYSPNLRRLALEETYLSESPGRKF